MEKIILASEPKRISIYIDIRSKFIRVIKKTATESYTQTESDESICNDKKSSYNVMVFDDFEVIYTIRDIYDTEVELVAEWVEEDDGGISVIFGKTLVVEFDKETTFCFEEKDVEVGEVESRSIIIFIRKDT